MLNRTTWNACRIRAASPDDPSTLPWQVVLLPPLLLFFRKAVQLLAGADLGRMQQPLPAVTPPLPGRPPGYTAGRTSKNRARTRDDLRIIFELYQRIRARPAPLPGRYPAPPPRFSPATGYPAVSRRAPAWRAIHIRGETIAYPVRRRYGSQGLSVRAVACR
jgi:hypothetical protein